MPLLETTAPRLTRARMRSRSNRAPRRPTSRAVSLTTSWPTTPLRSPIAHKRSRSIQKMRTLIMAGARPIRVWVTAGRPSPTFKRRSRSTPRARRRKTHQRRLVPSRNRPRHCERSEAIQRSMQPPLDCFVALLLAMTKRNAGSAFDLRKIGDRAGGGADFVEQLEPVFAQRLVVGVDCYLVEESIHARP